MSEDQSSRAWIIVLAVIATIAVVAYFILSADKMPKPKAPPAVEEPTVQEPAPDLEPQVEEEPAAEPQPVTPEPERKLPALNDSDKAAYGDLLSLTPDDALSRWLVPDEVIRKWVAAVNSAAAGDLVTKNRPFKNLRGAPVVDKSGATGMELSPENYQRYDTPVRLFAVVDVDTAVKLYRFWYPRLSEAYGELGVKGKSFHQVLLKAIDQVLAAPEAEQPIQLVRPSVYYKFADPKLEKLPGIHKLMIRMGPDNAARVKEKLKELKAALEKIPLQQNQ
ncbi:DUF3014 domain-containing protein [Microbulbifer hainanensis]|uniref:DUF3014 domain-containing protein n=1 Tax=Microbulbifer hainanensis TaxID=2735675 RepID=UPI0018664D5E|nr:DUF3014 domain-containing protein [Microbulbifer hainanensis]